MINLSRFKKGDEVIFVYTNVLEHEHLIGEECTILEVHTGLDSLIFSGCNTFYELSITLNTGLKLCCIEKCIEKKKPPKELSTWEEVQQLTNWSPSKIKTI